MTLDLNALMCELGRAVARESASAQLSPEMETIHSVEARIAEIERQLALLSADRSSQIAVKQLSATVASNLGVAGKSACIALMKQVKRCGQQLMRLISSGVKATAERNEQRKIANEKERAARDMAYAMSTESREVDELCREAIQNLNGGDAAAAKRILADAIERYPRSALVYFNMSAILKKEDHKRLLAGKRDQPVELAEEMAETWRSGRYDTLRYAQLAHELAPLESDFGELLSEVWACLGTAHERCGDLDNAFRAFARSQETAPSWHGKPNPTEWNIADILAKIRKPAKHASVNTKEEEARSKALAKAIREHAVFANRMERAYATLCPIAANTLDTSHTT